MKSEKYRSCINACYECAIACDHCSIQDMKEEDVQDMRHCIGLDRECAAICRHAAHMMSIEGEFVRELCTLCAKICDACAMECEKHTLHDHFKKCSEACRACAKECRKLAL